MPRAQHPSFDVARAWRGALLVLVGLGACAASPACVQDRDQDPGGLGEGGAAGQGGASGAGGSAVCATGAESTADRCADGCDNDDDGEVDCDDSGCCAARADCGASTWCGRQPEGNGWEGPLLVDDAALQALDPAQLPAGPAPCHAPALVRVEYAVDGDTLDVIDENGGEASGRVRVIGVDTPEVGYGDTASECYAEEAAEFTSQLTGHRVWLTFDAECRDPYDRLLAYVYVGGGENDVLERQLLRRGLARAFPFGDNRTFEQLFESDEQRAREEGAGQWSACP